MVFCARAGFTRRQLLERLAGPQILINAVTVEVESTAKADGALVRFRDATNQARGITSELPVMRAQSRRIESRLWPLFPQIESMIWLSFPA